MKEYLKNNTQVREDILNQKLFFELKEASAKRQVHLKLFKSDVDVDGFDIIIDNNDDNTLKCQVKSRFDATTPYFDIHKIMLKPSYYFFDSFEFIQLIGCPNDFRGIILIDGDIENEKIQTRYYYLDIFLLRAMELGIFKLTNQSKRISSELLNSLRVDNDPENKKISVLHSLFFPVKNVDALLAIMSFHSIYHHNLSFNILTVSKIVSGTYDVRYETNGDKIAEMRGHWETINQGLSELIHEDSTITPGSLNKNYFNRPR